MISYDANLNKISTLKLVTFTLTMATVFVSPVVDVRKVRTFGSYHSIEHSFEYIGSEYTQSSGDVVCRLVFSYKKGFSGSWGFRAGLFGGAINLIYAHDGTVINNAWHIWYHQKNGDCVANQ